MTACLSGGARSLEPNQNTFLPRLSDPVTVTSSFFGMTAGLSGGARSLVSNQNTLPPRFSDLITELF